jgi:hypothetical protein
MRLINLIVVTLFYLPAQAQTNRPAAYLLKGSTTGNGDPLAGALIIVYSCADSSIVASTYTGNNGEYQAGIAAPGCYYIIVQSLIFAEYRSATFTIDSTQHEWLLPAFQLNGPRVTGLQGVVVTDRKRLVERKIDRVVFHVNNLPSTAGGNAMDALQQAPGVKISDNDIALVAKSKVKLMVNDRLVYLSGTDLINYLRSIPADNIASIEIITMPPAKYDAGGNAGIINIKTKKEKDDGLNSALTGSFTKATYEKSAAGALLSYKKGNYTLYGNFSYSADRKSPNYETLLNYPAWTWFQKEKRTDKVHYGSYQAGIDYRINALSAISLSFIGSSTGLNLSSNNTIHVTNPAGIPDSSMFTTGLTTGNTSDGTFNLNYQWTGLNKKKLTLNADYFYHNGDRSAAFLTQNQLPNGTSTGFSQSQRIGSGIEIKVKTGAADYEQPLLKGLLSLGAKLTFINNHSMNSLSADTGKPARDLFDYEENTQAVYGSWKRSFNKKWELQAGVRGEYTQIKGISDYTVQSVRQSYARLFPSFYLLHTINDDNSVGLTYGRRINRPGYNTLNPFKWYTSSYSYSAGNPFLLPSYSHNTELTYSYKGDYSATLFLTATQNGFDQVTNVRPDTNLVELLYRNFLTLWSYGLNTSLVFRPVSWWQSTNDISAYRKISNSSLPGTLAHMSSFSAYLSTMNMLTINSKKTIIATVSFWYQFPEVDNYDKFDAYYNLNLGLRCLLFNKRLTVSLASRDLLRTQKIVYSSEINDVKRRSNNYYDTRNFSIAISWKLGKKEVKKKTTGNNREERERAN